MSSPNVLLIVLDAVRADHISCYGHDRETTPHIDELADDGIKYEHAFANSNWTVVLTHRCSLDYYPRKVGFTETR